MILYIFYKIGVFLVSVLPLQASYKIAAMLGDLKYMLSPRDRRYVHKNLMVALKNKDKKQIRFLSRSVFINFAKYLVDFFGFSKINLDFIKKNVTLDGIQYVDEALALKKGVILVSAHIGNWEMGGALLGMLGYKPHVVALNHTYKKTNDFFVAQRASKGVDVIPVGIGIRRCFDLLKDNMIIAIVGDKDFTNKGMAIKFFDKVALMPKGPATFSLKTGSPLVPCACIRNNDDTFTFYFDKPIYPNKTEGIAKNLESLTREYLSVLEKYIRTYPGQWHMFRYIWAQKPVGQ